MDATGNAKPGAVYANEEDRYCKASWICASVWCGGIYVGLSLVVSEAGSPGLMPMKKARPAFQNRF